MADLSTYDPIFKAAGDEWNVDPRLLKAIATQESGGNARAVSKAGAQGLMQIIPDTQRYLGVTDPNDPVQSIYGAAKYINEALEKEGSAEGALLYYHGGPGWRQAYGPESKAYVPAVTSHYVKLAPPPGTEAQPTAPTGPLIIGDSLASKKGLGGTGVVGAQPKAVLDSIAGLPDDQVKGRDVVLSSGASNNPAQAALVEQQIKALKDRGANTVTVVGVGDHPKLAGVNDALAAATARSGGQFVPVPADQLSPDRIHPTPQGYRTLLAAATPRTATDATPASAPPSAAPTGAGNAMPKDDPLSLLPPAPKATGTATPSSSDDPLSLLPPAPKGTAQTAAPAQSGGIARNVAAGVLEGVGGFVNVLSDPFGNLVGRPVETLATFAHDALAPYFGYQRFSDADRNALQAEPVPQPGTRAIAAIGDVVGAKPSDVSALTPGEQYARTAATGATMGALAGPGAVGPIVGTTGAVAGRAAGEAVPSWAAPAAELAGNVVGGVGGAGLAAGVNALSRGVTRFAEGPPPTQSPYNPASPNYRPPGGGGAVTETGAVERAMPGTSAHAKEVASAYYDIADKSGGTLTPQFTNRFIDSITAASKQTEAGKATAGQNAVSSLAERLETLREKPMTLKAAQEVDEALGDLIDKEYGVKGLSKDGRKLAQIQSDFRDQIQNAGEGDITGGTAGFDALVPARKAWSQAMKMDDLERIQQRANMTDNPSTSVRTQIRTLLNNRTKSRGYSDEEIAALKDAASRGVIGGAMHVFGSRLIPIAAGTAGAVTGPLHAIGAAVGAHAAGEALRAGSNALQAGRINRAMGVLGAGVPPPPP